LIVTIYENTLAGAPASEGVPFFVLKRLRMATFVHQEIMAVSNGIKLARTVWGLLIKRRCDGIAVVQVNDLLVIMARNTQVVQW
jgi:hypothetical protein